MTVIHLILKLKKFKEDRDLRLNLCLKTNMCKIDIQVWQKLFPLYIIRLFPLV